MKQLTYIVLLYSFAISAQVGIGTSNPTAALEITTTTNGRAALRLDPQSNATQVEGSESGQLAVMDNILYLFDATRGKWLSVEETVLEFGRLGNGSEPAEIEFGGGDLKNGPRMPFDGTIVGVSISATEDDNSREIGLYLNGIAVPNNLIDSNKNGVFTLDPTTLRYKNSKFNLDFTSGDMISTALIDDSVNDVDELIVSLIVKWRKVNN